MWKTVERPGYFGKMRNELVANWNKKFGENNWKIVYQFGDLVVPRDVGIQIYEDAYYEYLKLNPDTLDWLINTASDVYDTAPTNVEAEFSYDIQETPNNHIHDVAIRSAVLRNGKWFKGDHLIQVRSHGTEGKILSPMFIPFHLPDLISREEIKDYPNKGEWWRRIGIPDSVEEFYQQNKVLQIKK